MVVEMGCMQNGMNGVKNSTDVSLRSVSCSPSVCEKDKCKQMWESTWSLLACMRSIGKG